MGFCDGEDSALKTTLTCGAFRGSSDGAQLNFTELFNGDNRPEVPKMCVEKLLRSHGLPAGFSQ